MKEIKSILKETLSVERRITRDTIAALTDGDVQFRPTPEQRPFGAQALHIISSQETLLEAVRTGVWNWRRNTDLTHFPTAESILKKFDEQHSLEMAYYDSLEPDAFFRPVSTSWGPPEPLLQLIISFLAHEGHHRGQMVVYLRLKGMQPPNY